MRLAEGKALRRRWSLRSLGVQLAVLTAFCLILAIGTFGCFLAQDYAHAMERNVIQRTANITQQVAGGVSNALLVRDYLTVENQLLILEPVPGFRDVFVVSKDGAILSHVTADGSGFLKAVFARATVGIPPGHGPQQLRHGETLETWHPIGVAQVHGWVRLVSDLEPFYAEQRQIYWRTAVAGLIAAGFSLTLLLLFLRPRIRALKALTEFAGNLHAEAHQPLPIYRGSTDIEQLSISMSQAADRLASDAEALRLEQRRLRTVVENMPVLLNAYDERVGFIAWNKTCERVTGFTAEEIVGNPCALELLYPDRAQREGMLDEWRQNGSGGFHDWVLTLRTKSGEQRTISWSNLSEEFPIPGWSTWNVGIDITQMLENERLKDEFISTVNHELRTPLTAIHGALRLMMNEAATPLPPHAWQLVEIAERNCARLGRLISNVLDLQRIQSCAVTPTFDAVSVMRLARDAIESNRPFASLNGVSIEAAEGPYSDTMVCGDADKLMQVLTNLLSNAIKFSPSGTVVRVAVRACGDEALLEVRDQGPGIAEAFAGKIFQRFARAENGATKNVGGSGLGLCISKAIIEQHHGRIEFENNPGGGATFRVVLPIQQLDAAVAS